MLVTGDTEGRLRLYQLPNAKLLREFTGHVNDIVETQFMPATNQIISAGADGTLRFWDVR
jgi:WD40 repeat protein